MIKSFAHKGLADFFASGSVRGVQPKHAGQMAAPALRFHPLRGSERGRFAVDVDENFRVTFHFVGRDAVEVDYGDYH